MTDLNLSLVLRLMDRVSQPLRRIGGALSGLGRQTQGMQQRMQGLRRQQAAIDAFRQLKQHLDAAGQAMREAQTRAQGMGRELGQARRRAQTLRQGLSQAEAEVERLGRQMRETEHPTDAMRAAFQAAQQRAAQLRRELGQTEDQVGRLESSLETARQAVRRAAEAERALAERTERARRELGEAGIDVRRLAEEQARLRRATRAAADELANQTRRAAESQRRMEALARAQQRLARAGMAGAGMAGAGMGMQYAGRRALGAAAPAMDFNATLDAAMAKMQGSTDTDREALKTLALHLGGASNFSASQVAGGVDYLAMAGFNPQQIQDSLKPMLDMATAGGVGFEMGADIASNIISGMGMTAADSGRVADVLTATMTGSNVTMGELGETMKYAAPTAANLGVSLEVLAAATGVLGDAGIKGSMAGTTLSMALQRLASQPRMARDALDELGIATQDANGNMVPFEVILQRLSTAMKGMGDAERQAHLTHIFGADASRGISVLINNLESLNKKTVANAESTGRASEIAKKATDNLKGDVTSLFSSIETGMVRIGDAMEPTLRGISQAVTEVVRAFNTWAKDHPGVMASLGTIAAYGATAALAVGGLMTAVGAVIVPMAVMRFSASVLGIRLLGLGSVMRGIGRIGPLVAGGLGRMSTALGAVARVGPLVAGAFRAMGAAMLTTPIGWVAALALLLAGAAYAVYANWDKIGAWFKERWDKVKAAFEGGILNGIMALVQAFRPDKVLIDTITGLVKWLFGIDLKAVGKQWMTSLRDGFAETLQGLRAWFQEKIRAIVGVLPEWLQKKLGFASNQAAPDDEGSPPAPRPARDRRGRLIQAGSAMAAAATLAGAPAAADTPQAHMEQTAALALARAAPAPTTVPLIPAVPAGGPGRTRDTSQDGAPPTSAPVTNTVDNSTTSVTVNVPPGSDINAIVAAVTRELERRQRGALHDLQ